MSDVKYNILPKLHSTKSVGVSYKFIQKSTIDDTGKIKVNKEFDKLYIVRYRDNGKARFITIGKYSDGIRENYCKQKRSEFVLIAKNGELPPQVEKRVKKKIITLNDLADIYFDVKGKTQSGKKQQGRYNLHVKPLLGAEDVTKLEKSDFKALQKRLIDAEKAPKTINGILALVRAIIFYAIKEEGYKLENPASNIKPLKEDEARIKFLSINEVQELVKAVKKDDDLYTFVKMALATGARLEGILNIKKKDIDLTHDTVTITDFKNNSTYTGFFSGDKHKEEVQKRLRGLGANDKLIDVPSRTIQRKLKPTLDRLFNEGLEVRDFKNRVVIHTLRHTFASQLAIAGVPILTIKQLMNHGDISMTMRYAKLAPNQGKSQVQGLYND